MEVFGLPSCPVEHNLPFQFVTLCRCYWYGNQISNKFRGHFALGDTIPDVRGVPCEKAGKDRKIDLETWNDSLVISELRSLNMPSSLLCLLGCYEFSVL